MGSGPTHREGDAALADRPALVAMAIAPPTIPPTGPPIAPPGAGGDIGGAAQTDEASPGLLRRYARDQAKKTRLPALPGPGQQLPRPWSPWQGYGCHRSPWSGVGWGCGCHVAGLWQPGISLAPALAPGAALVGLVPAPCPCLPAPCQRQLWQSCGSPLAPTRAGQPDQARSPGQLPL